LTVLLPVRERVLGAEHPATLTARGDLARFTGWTGAKRPHPCAGRHDRHGGTVPYRAVTR